MEITKTNGSFGEDSHSRNKHGGTKVSLVDMGRDTPTDRRRISKVLNFLKPCPNLNWELCFGSPAAETASSNLVQDRFESYAKHQIWFIRLVVRICACHAQDAVSTTAWTAISRPENCSIKQCLWVRTPENITHLFPLSSVGRTTGC